MRLGWLAVVVLAACGPAEPEPKLDPQLPPAAVMMADLVVDRSELAFPAVEVGARQTLTFRVTNDSELGAAIAAVTPAPFELPRGSFALDPHQSAEVEVVFAPTELGDATGSAILATNGPAVLIALRGSAVACTPVDECTDVDATSGACEPLPDGTACGDGRVCAAGACQP